MIRNICHRFATFGQWATLYHGLRWLLPPYPWLSNAVASRFECHCFATQMSTLRDSIVVGFPSLDWVAPTFRHVFFSKGRAGGSSPYLVPRSNSAVDGDLAFRPALLPIYSGGRNVRPRLEAMQGRAVGMRLSLIAIRIEPRT